MGQLDSDSARLRRVYQMSWRAARAPGAASNTSRQPRTPCGSCRPPGRRPGVVHPIWLARTAMSDAAAAAPPARAPGAAVGDAGGVRGSGAAAGLVRSSLRNDPAALGPLLARVAADRGPCATLYVHIAGAGDCATAALLEWLAGLYRTAADAAPRLDIVPLLPFAGWGEGALAGLGALRELTLAPAGVGSAEAAVATAAAGSAAAGSHGAGAHGGHQGTGAAAHAGPPAGGTSTSAAAAAAVAAHAAAGVPPAGQPGEQRLCFERVAVGGTFDRLHAGHRLLLAATALVATDTVYAGVTADELLAKKAHRELLQPYAARRDAALDFMRAVRPGVAAGAGALRDPAEPTQAELDPAMQALVVSAETLAGGEAINRGRAARGFAPLRLVVVGVVGERPDGSKLSSSELRQRDAQAGAAGAGAGDGCGA